MHHILIVSLVKDTIWNMGLTANLSIIHGLIQRITNVMLHPINNLRYVFYL